MKWLQYACVVALFFGAGCTQSTSTASSTPAADSGAPTAPNASQQAMQNAIGMSLDPGGPVGGSSSTPPPPQPAVPPPAAPPVAPATEQVKAEAGVGQKGQSLQEHTGILVEPAKAYFRVEQKMVFNVSIPQAMQLFQATEGRKPNSHDEFMRRIVAENNIQLPTLPQGHKYVYNPEQGELMVEKPSK